MSIDGELLYREQSLNMHKELKGKIEIISRVKIRNKKDLSLAYTPGVAEPCLLIQKDVNLSYEYTRRWNTVAVISDGTAVLGLGDIGPEASMPVMEGKCVLFKNFANIDAIPLCIKSKDVDEIVNTIKLISGSFGAINLEDISAPRCFEIEQRLKKECDIPIFHDDQHGTAVVTLAALLNSVKIVKKQIKDLRVVINGAGAAGIAITRLLKIIGVGNIIVCDTSGAICKNRDNLNPAKLEITKITNNHNERGRLADIIIGADIFIGVSGPDVLTSDMVTSMSKDPIIFAMANPNPEIMPDKAKDAGAKIVGTGRSDFNNQINNLLAFPGILRGTLDTRAKDINYQMQIAAANAIANLIKNDELNEDYIIPQPFDDRVGMEVAKAVLQSAKQSGVARI